VSTSHVVSVLWCLAVHPVHEQLPSGTAPSTRCVLHEHDRVGTVVDEGRTTGRCGGYALTQMLVLDCLIKDKFFIVYAKNCSEFVS